MLRLAFAPFYNILVFPLALLVHALRRLFVPRGRRVVRLHLGQMPEIAATALGRHRHRTMERLAERLARAAADPTIGGLSLSLEAFDAALCDLYEVRSLVDRFRASGKPLHVHVEQVDWRSLLAAAPAERITAPPAATVMAQGIGLELQFLGGLFAQHGVRFHVAQRREYKGVMEPFVRREPTTPLLESLQAMVDDIFEQMAARLAGRPGWDLARGRRALEEGPHTLGTALAHGLVDEVVELDEAEHTLVAAVEPEPRRHRRGSRAGGSTPATRHPDGSAGPDATRGNGEREAGGRKPAAPAPPRETGEKGVAADAYLRKARPIGRVALVAPRPMALARRPVIAFVPVKGIIIDRPLGGFGRRQAAVASHLAPRIRALAETRAVAAIVLVIDSRGGTVSGSDRLWNAARYAQGRKPVVAWMRSYAASGGYYVAAAARHIVASPFTITGSIGVVSSKPDLSEAARQWDVNPVFVGRGGGAHAMSPLRPMDDREREWLETRMDEAYDRFKAVVADGRRLSAEAVEEVARGRVWTGPQAHARGLVDAIGTYADAVGAARALAGIPDARRHETIWAAPPEGLLQLARRLIDPGGEAPALLAALDPVIEPLLLAREGVVSYYLPGCSVWS
jgi:protease IV